MRFEDLSSEGQSEDTPRDNLYDQAFSLVVEPAQHRRHICSASSKSATQGLPLYMDELENKGVISPQEGASKRILIDSKHANSPAKSRSSYEEQEPFE